MQWNFLQLAIQTHKTKMFCSIFSEIEITYFVHKKIAHKLSKVGI